MAAVFVDRVDSVGALRGVALDLLDGRGASFTVEGDSGMGKSALLAAFPEHDQGGRDLAERIRFARVRCAPVVGEGNPYRLALDILTALREQSGTRRWWRRVGGAAARSAPGLLGLLVPGLGPVLEAGRGLTEAAMNSGSMPGDSLLPQQEAVAGHIADAILEEVSTGKPAMVLVDDVQYSDLSSLQVLHRLVEAAPGRPLGLVFGHGSYASESGNGVNAAALLEHWEFGGLIQRHRLTGLPEDAVAELVRLRHPDSDPSALSTRLCDVTDGHPIFVDQCLRLLRSGHTGQVPLPEDLPHAVRSRFARLDGDVRELLVVGATQGPAFLSRAVAEAIGAPHGEVMQRLRDTAQSHGLIRERQNRPLWVQWVGSDLYEFEHRALQKGIYEQQSAAQKQHRHHRLASALTALADAAGPGETPLELRLDIAGQLRRGGPQSLAASAAAHYELARSVAVSGLSFADAERHCAVAIRAARELPADGGDRDQRLVEAAELLLSLTEVRWQGHAEPTGDLDIDALAAEAEEAARRLADRRLIARTTLLRGKTLLATQGLKPSLLKLREAVDRARECGDPVSLFVALVEYGRQLPKQDLRAGLQALFAAEELYASEPCLGEARNPVLQHARNLNEMQLGVNLYDSGRLGEARVRLLRCTARLRSEHLRAELPIALNYLAQLHIATGERRQAQEVLREALDFEEARGGDSGWHAYNTALLALTLVHDPESRGRERALVLAEEAWSETQRTWLANLVPIVRNLYAEVLLETAADTAALDQAYRLAVDTCVETRQTGMRRSEIAAFMLCGRVRLRQGDAPAAAGHAREALHTLEEVGDMPALRTEEVLHHAARALHADGAVDEARALWERARAEVARKESHLDDAAQRRRFRTEVPLNRAILGEDEPS
ncbi:AAA family ATPase [Streptomyces pathocidini]|uniref:AAA family ATPase n=1 Tax=Streptomyces pathocidini TaxID=1650571 RepID=A0ABW7UYS9_9ACTN|nr:AAA family ATPase [Streptomyces pathocidini]